MSVGGQLGLDAGSELLDRARLRWPLWVGADGRLGVVESFDDLRSWLPKVTREEADEVLLVLAMIAAPDGGDDIAAAAALAKCLLPGACRLAGWLSSQPMADIFRDSQPIQPGAWWAVERIDELVASQLWIEVRSFPWRRLTKVASNIIVNTKVGVLREVGDHAYLNRIDRTWAHTDPVDSFVFSDAPPGHGEPTEGERLPGVKQAHVRVAAGTHQDRALAIRGPIEPDATPVDELRELLTWACENEVISETDRHLLLCLVSQAHHVTAGRTGRGYGGLISNELSMRVAPQLGVSEATVRRHASRSVRALAQAAARFGHDG